MLASLLSLPSAAASSTATFLSNRRRGLAYTASALGGAYVVGQWALGKVVETAERSRKEGNERDDLARRFSLNLQDSQFTVLALVPTVAPQLHAALDVEARSRLLADLAKREKAARLEEARKAAQEDEVHVNRGADPAGPGSAQQPPADAALPKENGQAATTDGGADDDVVASAETPQTDAHLNGHSTIPTDAVDPSENAASFDPPSEYTDQSASAAPATASTSEAPTSSVKLALNPAAPAFEPRSSSPPTSIAAPSAAPQGDEAASPPAPIANGHVECDGAASVLGKSWAEIAKEGVEEPPTPEDVQVDGAGAAGAAPDGHLANGAGKVDEEEKVPEKSKAELWHEIKLLSFTRLITSLYVLVLLTLQTHVQLALLGRASYIDSLLSSLPPRTPSRTSLDLPSASSAAASSDKLAKPLALEDEEDEDLERALYEAKRLPPTADERAREKERERKELETRYLTFSWWLLHEGWKELSTKVEKVVEEVVGPMGLKTPLVYGELSALFGEIRRRVELDVNTGKPHSFSSAIHPPTLAQEIQTLVSGGSYTPSPPASSSSQHAFPPSFSPSRPGAADPISPSLRSLLNETNDALDSPDAALVRALCLDKLFSLVVEKLEPAFRSSTSPPQQAEDRGARFEDVTEKQARLASLLPLLTRLSGPAGATEGSVLASGVNGNEFVEALEDVRELREYAAVLYGSWDRDNLRASCVL
ncbi:hypothetical protein Rhopal_000051-T1 [Rhodotorula paludigena]|uniref:Peroxin-3 n=1 Tax=Rhodotorula paludigena TaxID=86838 RepID=A0AAV5G403_9BASI|nr:hypothetical protein Rhopal_000051-T1 [Rhodotorula paludigena]